MTDDKLDGIKEGENAVEEARKLVEELGPQNEDGKVIVTISRDQMAAFIELVPPEGEGEPADMDAALDALKKTGVTYGINEQQIDEAFKIGLFREKVQVAEGQSAEEGEDASLEYKFRTEMNGAGTPQEDDAGRVDWRSLDMIENVSRDQVLAVKKPPTEGKPGKSVTGDEIKPKPGKDTKLPVGKNVYVSSDGNTVLAKVDGQAILKGGRVEVSPIYMIKSDVDYSIGNINFVGTVKIKGNVLSGFQVIAGGDIEIRGNVENALVKADGNVIVTGGYYGRSGSSEGGAAQAVAVADDATGIEARGDVIIRSVENGRIKAGGNVILQQGARYSAISARKDIVLDNLKGQIVGGTIRAGQEVNVSNLGSQSFTGTMVEVGINPEIREELDKIENEINGLREKLKQIERALTGLKNLQRSGKISPEKSQTLVKLTREQFGIKNQLQQFKRSRDEMLERMSTLRKGKVKVRGTVFPQVRIITQNAAKTIKRQQDHVSFYEKDGQIVEGAL